MKKTMKAAIGAAMILCAVFASCRKEEAMENPVSARANKPSGRSTGAMIEDRPKHIKGTIKNHLSQGVPDALVTLESASHSAIDYCASNSSGNFITNEQVGSGSYYIKVNATGYTEKFVGIIVPEDEDSIFDAGNIFLDEQMVIEP